jgi:hypothetical protein
MHSVSLVSVQDIHDDDDHHEDEFLSRVESHRPARVFLDHTSSGFLNVSAETVAIRRLAEILGHNFIGLIAQINKMVKIIVK